MQVKQIEQLSLAASFAVCLATPLAAHHSWTADYDGGKPVTVKGVVTKVEWTNPHTHFYVDVKDELATGGTCNETHMWNRIRAAAGCSGPLTRASRLRGRVRCEGLR